MPDTVMPDTATTPPTDPMPHGPAHVAAALTAARTFLIDYGWGREYLQHPTTGHVCLVGAVALAAGGVPAGGGVDVPAAGQPLFYEALDALALTRAPLDPGGAETALYGFNDRTARGVGDVLALIDATVSDLTWRN